MNEFKNKWKKETIANANLNKFKPIYLLPDLLGLFN